ncbi:unnamed protein product [Psylliodes chrysocephalus]|uniref:Origin recognition complex subunit 2 n=1 Tax=Psylliodes chrysocephalus TaxID=3402493 RepID=A0A9P0GFQ2_9CUCU|nr:unnamed protein product [Psylliodes chrysocephala]
MASSSVRRTSRSKKPSMKALESLRSLKIQNSGLVHPIISDKDDTDEEIYEGYYQEDIQKPKIIHENEVVHGEDMFNFPRRKTKDGIAQKVAEAFLLKTPHNIRKKTKKNIEKLLKEDSESDFEASSEEDESNSSSESSDSSDTDESDYKAKGQKLQFKEPKLQSLRTMNRNYNIQTEEYFEKSSSKKNVTSNNTLEKLETPRLPQYQLQKLLSNSISSNMHKDAMIKLNKVNDSCFKKWLYFLNENFNILLYGLGSKRHILNKFQNTYLKNLPVIVVNGYFPSLSVKNILDAIIGLLELENNPGNPIEACDLIVQEMKNIPDSHLYVIIHNIEGETLRNGKAQNILARLASISNVHFIASIDHINAPLIWDHKKLSKFNYIWWDATSFAQYIEETSYEQSMMVQQSHTLALSSLRNVFASLTSNSKSIYNLIVKYQLENAKSQYYQGLAFKDLYRTSRDSFIVSSDLALRAQLIEFVDHKMLKIKRSVDGTEYLLIPLENQLLQKFLDENK